MIINTTHTQHNTNKQTDIWEKNENFFVFGEIEIDLFFNTKKKKKKQILRKRREKKTHHFRRKLTSLPNENEMIKKKA